MKTKSKILFDFGLTLIFGGLIALIDEANSDSTPKQQQRVPEKNPDAYYQPAAPTDGGRRTVLASHVDGRRVTFEMR